MYAPNYAFQGNPNAGAFNGATPPQPPQTPQQQQQQQHHIMYNTQQYGSPYGAPGPMAMAANAGMMPNGGMAAMGGMAMGGNNTGGRFHKDSYICSA
jgi:hypothetical protein